MSGSSKARDTPPPSVIAGRYHVERLLGRGGMATVYLCTDSETNTKVAVKVLRGELGSAVIVERFLREIEFASELDHPRVPKVLDSGVTGELPFYVMTYIEGESLRERLDRLKQLPVDEAVSITAAVIEPMTYAHRLGIIHRDIKPGNILVGLDGVYVLDFGIARAILASADDRLTSTGVALGTPAYMSPEQALADHDLDARSDVYSLACVTYEMIAGIPPFVGATPQAVMARRFASPPSPLRHTRDGVPEHVDRAVAKALSRAPADRWQTAREFSDALTSPKFSESIQVLQRHASERKRWYARGIAATVAVSLIAVAAFAANAVRQDSVEQAQRSIDAWDFDAAKATLEHAVSENPDDSRALVWLAQVQVLRETPHADWKPLILRVTDRIESLDSIDALRVAALAALADGKFADACPLFERLSTMSSTRGRRDLASTLSFADCRRNDQAVVRDSASPSGYSFRSSYQQVSSVYEGLLERHEKSPGAFDRLTPRLALVLSVDRRMMRRGFLGERSGPQMSAQPQLVRDTLSYVPYAISPTGAPLRLGDPAALDAAAKWNAKRLQDVAARWIRLAPSSSAHEMLASLLETAGELEGSENSASNQIKLARRLASTEPDSSSASFLRKLRLGDSHARVLIRLGQFGPAGLLADSILELRENHSLDEATQRQATDIRWRLSALRGRAEKVIDLELPYSFDLKAYTPSGPEDLPPVIARDATAFAVYAAFGGPADSITLIADRISDRIDALVPPAKAGAIRKALMTQPLMLASPVIGAQRLADLGPTRDPVALGLIAMSARDLRAVRRQLDTLEQLQANRPPGAISLDVTYLKAWLSNSSGDRARAKRILDNAFKGMSTAPPSMLGSPALIAALVRSMLLRSEIATTERDSSEAQKWRNAASALWGRGDSAAATLAGLGGAPARMP